MNRQWPRPFARNSLNAIDVQKNNFKKANTYIPHTFYKNCYLYNPFIYLKFFRHTAGCAPFWQLELSTITFDLGVTQAKIRIADI
jgi:hypothetical protein